MKRKLASAIRLPLLCIRSGARTFLSAATPERSMPSKSTMVPLPFDLAADKNVRAPLRLRSALQLCCAFAIGLLAFQATKALSVETEPSAPTPFPTGSHLQLVRRFFTIADGLPANDILAVTATREGAALAATGKGLVRLEGERWLKQTGPAEVHALFAPAQGPSALAGGTNGVWALTNGQWQMEEGSPAGVIAFAAEPEGVPWALALSGVWRREKN